MFRFKGLFKSSGLLKTLLPKQSGSELFKLKFPTDFLVNANLYGTCFENTAAFYFLF